MDGLLGSLAKVNRISVPNNLLCNCLARTDDSWLKYLLVWWLKMAIYYFCHSFNISWHSFAHSPLWNSYNFIINGSISMNSGISEIITACVIVHIWYYSFRRSNCPNLADSPFELAPMSLWHTPSVSELFLIFWHSQTFQARTGISHFPKEPRLLLVNDRHQNWGSGVFVATGVSLLLGPFQWTELVNEFFKKASVHTAILFLFNTRKFSCPPPFHMCIFHLLFKYILQNFFLILDLLYSW